MKQVIQKQRHKGYRAGMLSELASLRFHDLEIFVEVSRAKSIREAGRRLEKTSGQISKSIQGLEKRLSRKLLKRSAQGVILTEQGTELLEMTQVLFEEAEKIERWAGGKDKHRETQVLAIASNSFLNNHLVAPTSSRLNFEAEGISLRFIDLPPDQLIPQGLRGLFEMAVHYGSLSWPSTWVTKPLGKSRWVLCARNQHPLPKKPSLDQVLHYPFVIPAYTSDEGLTRGNDQFPLAYTKRKVGHEATTADTAMAVVMNSDQITFIPEVSAKIFLQTEVLREVKIRDFPASEKIEKEIYLTVKADSIQQSLFLKLLEEMRKSLREGHRSQ
jgi:DNA-binding transcriptional LysR family regulator